MIKEVLRWLIVLFFLKRSQSVKLLKQVKLYQLERFENSLPKVRELRNELSVFDGPHEFIDENWNRWSKQVLELYESDGDLWRFSRHPVIIKTMTGAPVRRSSSELLQQLSASNRYFTLEEMVGDNLLNDKDLCSSSSRMAHLYVLSLIEEDLKAMSYAFDSIVEIGGGFGGLASLFLRKYHARYHIFDLWQMLPLQYSYLYTVLGDNSRGSISDCSLSPIQALDVRSGDSSLFISNWALTESTAAMQRFVIDNDFLGADIAVVCCEDNNTNHKDSMYIHDYLKTNCWRAHGLRGGLCNSMMYVLDLR